MDQGRGTWSTLGYVPLALPRPTLQSMRLDWNGGDAFLAWSAGSESGQRVWSSVCSWGDALNKASRVLNCVESDLEQQHSTISPLAEPQSTTTADIVATADNKLMGIVSTEDGTEKVEASCKIKTSPSRETPASALRITNVRQISVSEFLSPQPRPQLSSSDEQRDLSSLRSHDEESFLCLASRALEKQDECPERRYWYRQYQNISNSSSEVKPDTLDELGQDGVTTTGTEESTHCQTSPGQESTMIPLDCFKSDVPGVHWRQHQQSWAYTRMVRGKRTSRTCRPEKPLAVESVTLARRLLESSVLDPALPTVNEMKERHARYTGHIERRSVVGSSRPDESRDSLATWAIDQAYLPHAQSARRI